MRYGLTERTLSVTFYFADLVGRYRLVMTDELVEFIERAFVAPAPPADRERVRREALEEAGSAELEIHAGGMIVSRAGAQEFYRVHTSPDGRAYERFDFDKAPGMPVMLVLASSERLLAQQPNKPVAEFRRIGRFSS
jgi:hypothetical protein